MTYQFEKDGTLKAPAREELVAADADSYLLVLDQGNLEDGTPYWAYVAVKPSKYEEFVRLAKARQPLRLNDYGTILRHGFEPDVPDAVREEMRREHGFDERFISKRLEAVKKAQAEFLKTQEDQRLGDIVAMLKKKQGG